MFYVPQLSKSDCGFTCLKILLAHFHHNRKYLYLPADEDHGAYSYKDLFSLARENGMSLSGFKVKEKKEILNVTNLPLIVRIRNENGTFHAVIMRKIRKNDVYIVDPHLGNYKLKFEKFCSIWDGTGMHCSHISKEVKDEFENFEPISKMKKFFAYIIQILTGVCLITAIYFIQPESNYIIPVSLLILSLVLEILLRLYLFKLMKDIDDYFEEKYSILSCENYFIFYERSQIFKQNYLHSKISLVYSILISVFIIFVTIFNNVFNFPLIFIAILVAGLEQLYLKPKEKLSSQKLADKEEELKKIDNEKLMVKKVKLLQKEAYKFSRFVLGKKLFYAIALTGGACVVQFILDDLNLINLVFNFCIEIFLYQYLVPIFSFEDSLTKMAVCKSKLSNVLYKDVYKHEIISKK